MIAIKTIPEIKTHSASLSPVASLSHSASLSPVASLSHSASLSPTASQSPTASTKVPKLKFRHSFSDTRTEKYDILLGIDRFGNPYKQSGCLSPRSPRAPTTIEYNDGIYIFLKDKNIEIPGCNPRDFIFTVFIGEEF
jgi:hypothetical protein